MVLGIIAGITGFFVILFAMPVQVRILCRGADPLHITVGLYWGRLPLWIWRARKETGTVLQSTVRFLLFPGKRMLPGLRRAKAENGKKKGGFRPEVSLRFIRIDARIPWDDGWETLQLLFAQYLAGMITGRVLCRKETRTDFNIRVVPPGEKTVFTVEAIMKLQWWSTLIQIGRKAVKMNESPD